jgi:hypothetical protein
MDASGARVLPAIIQLMPIAIFDSDFTQFGGREEVECRPAWRC